MTCPHPDALRAAVTDLRCPLCMEAENARLQSALKPFADYSERINGNVPDACPLVAAPNAIEGEPTVGDLRRAAQALAGEQHADVSEKP